jgi:hypothetical protein
MGEVVRVTVGIVVDTISRYGVEGVGPTVRIKDIQREYFLVGYHNGSRFSCS